MMVAIMAVPRRLAEVWHPKGMRHRQSVATITL